MKKIRGIFTIIFLLAIVIGGSVFYAFKIEPYRIELEEVYLNEKTETSTELKIVQLTDIHLKEDFEAENLTKIIKLVNDQQPDIVLFTGDLYDNYAKYHKDEETVQQLGAIETNAKLAIWGNRDYGGGAQRRYEDIMEQSGFQVLMNEQMAITVGEHKVLFTGLDDSLLGAPEMPDASNIQDVDYKILLSHEPDTIERYRSYPYDIAISGHSHGGQFNILFAPFINEQATETTNLSSIYRKGMYDLTEGNIKKVFVSTGIGTTHISARFGVIPKVTLFHVYLP